MSPCDLAKMLGISDLFIETSGFNPATADGDVLPNHTHPLSDDDKVFCSKIAACAINGQSLPEGCELVSTMDTKLPNGTPSGKHVVVKTDTLRPASAKFVPRNFIPEGTTIRWRPNKVNGSNPERYVYTPEFYGNPEGVTCFLTIFADLTGKVSNCFAGGDPPSDDVVKHISALKNRFNGNLSAVLTRLVDCERQKLPVPPALIEEATVNGEHLRYLFNIVMIRLDKEE
jgi:hypothetical protein